MKMSEKTIFVIGAGKGCGNHVAERFGREGFRVVLMSRSRENLDAYEADFSSKGIDVVTEVMDVSDPDMVVSVFDDLKCRYGVPDVLFYNVGVTTPDSQIEGGRSSEILIDRYRVDVAGAFLAIQQVMGAEFEAKGGTILVTGGGLALHPMEMFLPLSMDKAALRAMCFALHDAYAERGVFVGTVTVTGLIAPGSEHDPALLAEDFWNLYTERSDCEIVH